MIRYRLRHISIIIVGVSFLSACVQLPKEATQAQADQVAALSKGLTELEGAYVRIHEEARFVRAVESGLLAEIAIECQDGVSKLKASTINKINLAVEGNLDSTWIKTAGSLYKTVEGCNIKFIEDIDPETGKPYKRPRPDEWDPSLTLGDYFKDKINDDFNKQLSVLLRTLSGYYGSIAVAAKAEDIDKQIAAIKDLQGHVLGAIGNATSVLGVNVKLILDAAFDLLNKVARISLDRQRYDEIERALEAVSQDTLNTVENAIGLSVVFLQTEIVSSTINNRLYTTLLAFNTTPPEDIATSETQLRIAVNQYQAMKAIVDKRLVTGLSNLAETHQSLLAGVQARERKFSEYFKQLVELGKAVDALRKAAADLRSS